MPKTLMIAAAGLAALALAGCGGGEKAANDSVVLADNSVATTPAPPEAAPGPAVTPSPAVSPTASPSPDTGTGIPVALHGRWGLVPGDCTSTRGDNKGLLTITAETLRFYESVGTLGKVVERDPTRIVADFAMTGEGQEWTRRMVLDAEEDGKALVRREQGPDAMLGLLRYQRCA